MNLCLSWPDSLLLTMGLKEKHLTRACNDVTCDTTLSTLSSWQYLDTDIRQGWHTSVSVPVRILTRNVPWKLVKNNILAGEIWRYQGFCNVLKLSHGSYLLVVQSYFQTEERKLYIVKRYIDQTSDPFVTCMDTSSKQSFASNMDFMMHFPFTVGALYKYYVSVKVHFVQVS